MSAAVMSTSRASPCTKRTPDFVRGILYLDAQTKQTYALNECLLFAFCASAETVICPAVSLPLNAFCLLHIRHEQLVTNRRCTLPRFTCITQNFEPHYDCTICSQCYVCAHSRTADTPASETIQLKNRARQTRVAPPPRLGSPPAEAEVELAPSPRAAAPFVALGA